MALRAQFGGPFDDPEVIPDLPRPAPALAPARPAAAIPPAVPAPVAPREAQTIDLGGGFALRLVRVAAQVPFWIGKTEVSNGQFRRFDPRHNSRYCQKRYPPLPPATHDTPDLDPRGLTLNGDR